MATTTGTVNFYNNFFALIGNAINLHTDTFGMLLLKSTYTPSAAHIYVADTTPASNETTGGNYARITNIDATYTQTGGVGTFTFSNPVFTAGGGGNIVARYWAIYDVTLGSSDADRPLVCYGLLDSGNLDVTTTDGNTLTFNVNASGLFTVQLGA